MAKKKLSPSDKALDRIYRQVTTRPPVITEALADELERSANDPNHGVARRMALAVLMRPGGMLRKAMEDRAGAVAFSQGAQAIRAYLDHLDALKEMLESAATQIEVALCAREDMKSVVKEARLPDKTPPKLRKRGGTFGLAA